MSDRAVAEVAALTIFVNGEPITTPAQTLVALVAALGHQSARVATAVNGEFVPARERSAVRLSSGDRIEIVSPRQGG